AGSIICALCLVLGALQSTKIEAQSSDGKKPPVVTAIVGADILTVTKGVIRGGTVLIKDGKIIGVGQDVAVPEGAIRIDASGKVVTPGFITVSATNVGI